MRVLIPLHTFLPVSRFGAELYTYYLAHELRNAGVEIHLFFSEINIQGTVARTFEGFPCTVVE